MKKFRHKAIPISEDEGFEMIPENTHTVLGIFRKGTSIDKFVEQIRNVIEASPECQRCTLLFEKGVSRKTCNRITDMLIEAVARINNWVRYSHRCPRRIPETRPKPDGKPD